jgi:hypothetical protein
LLAGDIVRAVSEQEAKPGSNDQQWYSVRRVVEHYPGSFEERITIWLASSFEEAIELSEAEGADYAETLEVKDLGIAQCFQIDDTLIVLADYDRRDEVPPRLAPGVEVFSLIRDVPMDADTYVTTYFATGNEHQRIIE